MIEYLPIGQEDLIKNFVALVIGVIANWLLVCRQEKISILAYWKEERTGSYNTLLGALVTFALVMYMEPNVGPLTYFTIGIACDSVLNKLPLPDSVKQRLRTTEEKVDVQEKLLSRISDGDDDVVDRLRAEGSGDTDLRDKTA